MGPTPPTGATFDRRRLFLSACGALFVFGVVLALLGTLFGMPEMRARMQVTDMVRQGDLQTLLLFGVFLATVIAGPLSDRFGTKLMLAVSALLATVALIGFATGRGYPAAQVCGFVLGFGGGGLNMAANVLTSLLFEDDRGPKLNLLAVFFGVGAMFIALAAAAVGSALMPAVMLIAAAISAGCLASYLVLPFPPARHAGGFSLLDAGKVVRYPGVLLFAFLLFFESGNEAAFIGWTSTWAGGMAATARNATLVLALFQAMMMLGRISASRVLRVMTEQQLVLLSGAGALISTLIVAVAPTVPVLAIGVALGGLTCASIYPTILAIAGDRYPSFAGTVFGVLFAIGLSGGMVFPWSIGHLSQSFGFRAGMAMPLLGASMICALLLVIRARDARSA
jgi:FHS family glucose/mannose:H+ symporter-like MFS transporter